ncbi:bifunctional diguanylate cyclase/phosphodiesterase [Erwinia sp. 9145]|uniref:putative bifunctional diguanylate cyclase/phosphodiesterase n=1 Tax=Erwinia sp. 9145 TaxID=1500895 RepID=UPI000558FAC0|nr:bifunctional diguanylate cyclase/phosphodiesterase [Erwinia sp. 9145]
MLMSSYHPLLVTVSVFVAFLASYTALEMAGRAAISSRDAARAWLIGGGVALGIGIWAMHFIGMLAMSLEMVMSYDPVLTVMSMAVAIATSTGALWFVCHDVLPPGRLILAALVLGTGAIAMHYIGMAALIFEPGIIWDGRWIALSVGIALLASFIALGLAFRLRRGGARIALLRAGAATVMGMAIAGMHYTGMAAAHFPMSSHASETGVDSNWLAVLVTVVTLSILGITLLVSTMDARLQKRAVLLTSSLVEANRELAQLALHDNLTRLPNRILLEDRLEQAMNKAVRESTSFALMFMDLDGFKAVNDAFGHHVGDTLLVAVADRMKTLLKEYHTLARLGGDEFVLLLEGDEPNDAAALADKLVNAVDAPFWLSRYELSVSLSIGIAVFPGDGNSERELMFNADTAMYHTKNSGRNGYSFFQPSMNEQAQNQLQLTRDLFVALERNEFCLVWQPIFSVPQGAVQGFEALLRWQHPQHGLLTPDRVLPLAEKAGLGVPLTHWIINQACRQLRAWHLQADPHWSITLNLSAMQFVLPELAETVSDALATHHIPPARLTLEVTEAIAMRNPDESEQVLKRLTALGIRVGLDDFGTGYSSLFNLHRLPFSQLKIDRRLVSELDGSGQESTVIAAIVALARALKLPVVAKGVETPQQQRLLSESGCNALQGYLFGEPLPGSAIAGRYHHAENQEKQPLPMLKNIPDVMPHRA